MPFHPPPSLPRDISTGFGKFSSGSTALGRLKGRLEKRNEIKEKALIADDGTMEPNKVLRRKGFLSGISRTKKGMLVQGVPSELRPGLG